MAALASVGVTLIALACSVLLAKGYVRSRSRMLFWSSLCFAGLTASNAAGFIDINVARTEDLFNFRLFLSAASMGVLVIGFIWESD